MKKYTVYKITNKINDKIYIGVHVTNNLNDDYMGSGKILKIAQEKYGIENFEKEYLHIFDSPDKMFEMESTLVNELFIQRNDTYNIRTGGSGGFTKAEAKLGREVTNKILEEKYGNDYASKISKDYHNGLSNKDRIELTNKIIDGLNRVNFDFANFKGKKHTKESKRKIGEANSKYQSGKGNSQYGKMWIYNEELKESKRIDKSSEIPEGWKKGRKIKW